MVTPTVADDPARTVTLDALNVTVAKPVVKPGTNGFGPVDKAGAAASWYVTAVPPWLLIVRFCVTGRPAGLSPRDNLPGETRVVFKMDLSMCNMPAPCRWTLSRNPSAGLPHQRAGSAPFCRMSRTAWEGVCGDACSSSAAAPATWGEDIEVPLRLA